MANAAKKDLESVRSGPLSTVHKLENEIERVFAGRWPRLFDWPLRESMLDMPMPSVDVVDREEEICVRAELPGFKKKEVDISVNDSTLTIKAQSKSDNTEEDGDYFRREISRGFVSRTVALPAEVDGDNAKASLSDGMLEVTVPKLARAKRKQVKID